MICRKFNPLNLLFFVKILLSTSKNIIDRKIEQMVHITKLYLCGTLLTNIILLDMSLSMGKVIGFEKNIHM